MNQNKFLVWVLVLFILITQQSKGQSRWVHSYYENEDAPLNFFLESYDNGYLLSGKHGANYSTYNWFIKTDINGEILWEKTIGGINAIVFVDITQDESGNIYLGGGTTAYDPNDDPIILKLNSCGEKEWCRVFYTENNNDFSTCLTGTIEGNIAVVLNNTNPEPWIDEICLAKLSSDGDLIWKQCYTSTDTSQRNEFSYDLIQTPDSGFLVTGFCYYEDPEEPNHWIPHPYLLKVDSVGNFEWETVVFKETNKDGGWAGKTIVSPDQQYYYSSGSHYHYDSIFTSSPVLFKLNMSGNVVDVYDVVSGYTFGSLHYAQFLNDSTIAASAHWSNNEDSIWSTAVLIDTMGNLLSSTVLVQDFYASRLEITYDNKLLYASNTYQNGQFDCFLTKLNQDLEDDTIYTMPFTYDSLCPYQIVSDTIVQDDCGLIVGVPEEEKGRRGEEGIDIELWPNPCSTVLYISLSSTQPAITTCHPERSEGSYSSYTVDIYDIFGRKVCEEITSSTRMGRGREGGWTIDVSALPPGLYLLVLNDGMTVKASAKFVVTR